MFTKEVTKQFEWRRDGITILVEEEYRVRAYWQEFFSKAGADLRVFHEPQPFIDALPRITLENRPLQFFLDQDMGIWRGVGTQLARLVRPVPQRVTTALVTAYYPESFGAELREGIVDFIFDKYPPGIFGADYFKKRYVREMDGPGSDALFGESLAELRRAVDPDRPIRTRFNSELTKTGASRHTAEGRSLCRSADRGVEDAKARAAVQI